MAGAPQTEDQMQAAVAGIAAQALGAPPQQPQQPQQPASPSQQPTTQSTGQDTAQDKAAEAGAPKTEGDKQVADPVIYEVDMGDGKKRKLTPEQISQTFARYSSLNYRNAQMKPVMDVIDQVQRDNPGISPSQLAEKMQAIYRAAESNPTMGDQGKTGNNAPPSASNQAQSPEDIEQSLTRWEQENAATLPPGYKDMMMAGGQAGQGMAQMQQQLAQMQRMMQAVLAQSQGTADAAQRGFADAQAQQSTAIRQTIANNIDRVQAALQIPDEKAQDFMVYAAERGFTLEDFVDPQLTIKVMQDFRNSMDSPEMERMRQIAQRRQAFTGTMGQTAGASAQPVPNGGTTFDKLTDTVMAAKVGS